MATIPEDLANAVQHHQAGRFQAAQQIYAHILQADPRHAEAHHLLGVLAFQTGYHRQAITLIRQALALDPNHVDAYNNLGNVLGQQKQLAEAAECFRQALRLDPKHANAHYNLGTALVGLRQLAPAIEHFRHAMRLNPNHADTHNNLGNALVGLGLLDEAAACFQQALRLSPNRADIQRNLGVALAGQGQLGQAAQCYEQALRLDPGHRLTLLNRSLLRLLQGDFAGGWLDYEQRWAQSGMRPRCFEQPRWDGTPLAGKTVLVYADEALGDTIQFARYLPIVQKCGGRVLFECQPELASLFAEFSGMDQLLPAGSSLPAFDVQMPLLGLPAIFGTTATTIPADTPYLVPDPKLVEHWRQELEAIAPVPDGARLAQVGIVWQGNPQFVGDQLRSIPLRYFEPLSRVPGVRLISLQKGPGAEQLRDFAAPCPILGLGDRLDTFSDTAAVLKNLDLIISSDTALPHLAGALGLPVWTALQLVPDWRWFLDRDDSPWYPTMRLFRQKTFGDWGEVFERMAEELGNRSQEKNPAS